MGATLNRLTLAGPLLLAILAGCASGPPPKLLEQEEYAALSVWYEEEAARLRAHAEDHRLMAERYEELTYRPRPKVDMAKHCRNLVSSYSRAAEEAGALAELYRERSSSSP